jgi:hypothetical protein
LLPRTSLAQETIAPKLQSTARSVDRTNPSPLPQRKKNASDHVERMLETSLCVASPRDERADQREIHPRQGDSLMTTKKKPSERKFGPAAGKQVETEMREFKRGKLKSGRSGKTVTSRKQAIAIGLSEARKQGAKVPRKKS